MNVIITGEYDRLGYTVLVNGHPVYNAGNGRHESTIVVGPGRPASLRLPAIRRACRLTCRDVAQERRCRRLVGVERVDET